MISIFTGFRVRTIRWHKTNSPDICCCTAPRFAEVAFNLFYFCSGCRTLPCRFPWPVSSFFLSFFRLTNPPNLLFTIFDALSESNLRVDRFLTVWYIVSPSRSSVRKFPIPKNVRPIVDRRRFRIVTVLCV